MRSVPERQFKSKNRIKSFYRLQELRSKMKLTKNWHISSWEFMNLVLAQVELVASLTVKGFI